MEETPVEMTIPTAEMVAAVPEIATADTSNDLEKMQAALKKANNEAAKYRKQVEALETADNQRKQAELSEMEKLQLELKQTKERADALTRQSMQITAAQKAGLPVDLASRLVGGTQEEMEEDAKSILALIPKPTAPAIGTTNPAGASPQTETREQRLKRLGFA